MAKIVRCHPSERCVWWILCRDGENVPVLYEAEIVSPKLLHAAASPQAQAATSALSAAVRALHATLLQAHPDM